MLLYQYDPATADVRINAGYPGSLNDISPVMQIPPREPARSFTSHRLGTEKKIHGGGSPPRLIRTKTTSTAAPSAAARFNPLILVKGPGSQSTWHFAGTPPFGQKPTGDFL